MQGLRLASLALVLASLTPSGARASSPEIPGTGAVVELDHQIELTVAPEGASLLVTRTLFNAAPTPAQVELPIPLPCAATLDRVEIEERDKHGQMRRRSADVLDVDDAAQRWDAWLAGPSNGQAPTAFDADTALHLHRDHCDARLSIWPIPPMHEREVGYRVFIPSTYVGGGYEIELPTFDAHGKVASITLAGWRDASFLVEVDGASLTEHDVALLGDQAHAISLQRRDAGLALVRAADLDLAELLSKYPAAAARLEPDEHLDRMLAASFEPPRELASLPPVRRVVVVVDASRSFVPHRRAQLQRLAARYLELLAAAMPVRAEIILFDRQPRRVYHDFMPAAWVAEDLAELDVDDGNGSHLDLALAAARDLLATPSEREGVDWILVLGDLYLRSSFPLQDELAAAASSPVRMHVVRPPLDGRLFQPGAPDEAWTMIAREAGGMLWYTYGYDLDVVASELIRPTRIWSLRLELALADGSRREEALADSLVAGESFEWLDAAHVGPALERAAFVGEVWGQRRAWTAAPTEDEGLRAAGRLATEDDLLLSDAVRSALAHHAGAITAFTSAWAVAGFGGPAAAPRLGAGLFGSRGFGHSIGCGGASGYGHHRALVYTTLAQLVEQAVANCQNAKPGTFSFETTEIEIVDVTSDDPCIREQIWALDITPTDLTDRRAVVVQHDAGRVLGQPAETVLGYRDLIMPTPNITTNTASGMK